MGWPGVGVTARVEHRLALLPGLGVVMRCWVLRERATGFYLVGRELGETRKSLRLAWQSLHQSVLLLVSAGCWVTGVSVDCVCSLLVNCIVDVSIFYSVHFFVRIPEISPPGVG